MQRDSGDIYDEINTHHYVCNTLQTNPIILMGEPELSDRPGVQEFVLFQAKDIYLLGLGKDILVMVPKQSYFYRIFGGKEIMSFPAFYLPYAQNDCILTDVPSDAQIIITPALSGCSFVGELNSATPMVAHINRLRDGETNDLEMEQDIRNITQAARNYFVVRKDDYYDPQGSSATIVFGLKIQDNWEFTCQTVADNHITQLITTSAKRPLLIEQETRLRLIKLRDQIYHRLIANKDLYSKKSAGKRISFSVNETSTQLRKYHFWIPKHLQRQLKIIESAQAGQLSWSRAEQMLEFMKLRYTTRQRPVTYASVAANSFFFPQEQRQYGTAPTQKNQNTPKG